MKLWKVTSSSNRSFNFALVAADSVERIEQLRAENFWCKAEEMRIEHIGEALPSIVEEILGVSFFEY